MILFCVAHKRYTSPTTVQQIWSCSVLLTNVTFPPPQFNRYDPVLYCSQTLHFPHHSSTDMILFCIAHKRYISPTTVQQIWSCSVLLTNVTFPPPQFNRYDPVLYCSQTLHFPHHSSTDMILFCVAHKRYTSPTTVQQIWSCSVLLTSVTFPPPQFNRYDPVLCCSQALHFPHHSSTDMILFCIAHKRYISPTTVQQIWSCSVLLTSVTFPPPQFNRYDPVLCCSQALHFPHHSSTDMILFCIAHKRYISPTTVQQIWSCSVLLTSVTFPPPQFNRYDPVLCCSQALHFPHHSSTDMILFCIAHKRYTSPTTVQQIWSCSVLLTSVTLPPPQFNRYDPVLYCSQALHFPHHSSTDMILFCVAHKRYISPTTVQQIWSCSVLLTSVTLPPPQFNRYDPVLYCSQALHFPHHSSTDMILFCIAHKRYTSPTTVQQIWSCSVLLTSVTFPPPQFNRYDPVLYCSPTLHFPHHSSTDMILFCVAHKRYISPTTVQQIWSCSVLLTSVTLPPPQFNRYDPVLCCSHALHFPHHSSTDMILFCIAHQRYTSPTTVQQIWSCSVLLTSVTFPPPQFNRYDPVLCCSQALHFPHHSSTDMILFCVAHKRYTSPTTVQQIWSCSVLLTSVTFPPPQFNRYDPVLYCSQALHFPHHSSTDMILFCIAHQRYTSPTTVQQIWSCSVLLTSVTLPPPQFNRYDPVLCCSQALHFPHHSSTDMILFCIAHQRYTSPTTVQQIWSCSVLLTSVTLPPPQFNRYDPVLCCSQALHFPHHSSTDMILFCVAHKRYISPTTVQQIWSCSVLLTSVTLPPPQFNRYDPVLCCSQALHFPHHSSTDMILFCVAHKRYISPTTVQQIWSCSVLLTSVTFPPPQFNRYDPVLCCSQALHFPHHSSTDMILFCVAHKRYTSPTTVQQIWSCSVLLTSVTFPPPQFNRYDPVLCCSQALHFPHHSSTDMILFCVAHKRYISPTTVQQIWSCSVLLTSVTFPPPQFNRYDPVLYCSQALHFPHHSSTDMILFCIAHKRYTSPTTVQQIWSCSVLLISVTLPPPQFNRYDPVLYCSPTLHFPHHSSTDMILFCVAHKRYISPTTVQQIWSCSVLLTSVTLPPPQFNRYDPVLYCSPTLHFPHHSSTDMILFCVAHKRYTSPTTVQQIWSCSVLLTSVTLPPPQFNRYDPVDGRITERDFAEILLLYAGLADKKRARMLKRVRKAFKNAPQVCHMNHCNGFCVCVCVCVCMRAYVTVCAVILYATHVWRWKHLLDGVAGEPQRITTGIDLLVCETFQWSDGCMLMCSEG